MLQDEKESLDALNGNLEKLQSLCEQLDPLETTHTDLHFLDVDFEQTQQQYDFILNELREEIDEENQLSNMQKQLEAELRSVQEVAESGELQQIQDLKSKILPELVVRRESLQETILRAREKRKNVKPISLLRKVNDTLENVKASLDERINILQKREMDALIKDVKTELESLSDNPTEEAILALQNQLAKMPKENAKVTDLLCSLMAIEDTKKMRDKIRNDVDQHLANIAGKLKDVCENHSIAPKIDKKKRKQKKKSRVPSDVDRGQRMEQLSRDIRELEEEFLPLIDRIKADVIAAKLDGQPCDEQHSQIVAVIENLKVRLLQYSNQGC